jgi:hypothetical protein
MADPLSVSFAAGVPQQSRPFPAIAVGGSIVGVLDLIYAILLYSPRNPVLIVLGAKSYSLGAQSTALGVVLHFIIAFGAATAYYLASRKVTWLLHRAVLSGLTYGVFAYLFMHLIVLPLSAVPKGEMPLIYKACEFVEHCFCVGLPIALSVRHYSKGTA